MFPVPAHHRFAGFMPGRPELRGLVALAVPIATVQVGLMFMGVVDTIMVGHVSASALAAVAVGNTYFFIAAVFGMGVLMALDPIVSQAVGAHDEPAIARAVQRGFLIAAVITAWTALVLFFAEPALRMLKQPAEVIGPAARYSRVLIPGAFPFFAFVVVRQSLQSMTVIRPIILAIIIGNLCNIALNWVLIFGHFGFQAMGVAGAAWATSVSRLLLFLIVLAAGWPALHQYVRPWRRDAFELAPVVRMLRLGAPIGLHTLLEYGAFACVMIAMGMLGTVQVASHQVAINLASLTFMVPLGVAQAGGVLVGQAVGRGDSVHARRAAGGAVLLGAGFMTGTAVAFLTIPRFLAGIYTSDPAVLALSVSLIQIAGVFQIFDGLQVVGAGVLRGVGDTRVPMMVGLIGFWLIGVPASAYLGLATSAGARGLWWGLVVGLAVVGVFLVIRVYYRLRGELSRVAIDHDLVAVAG
ncbi:MAG TPA: MATE family efflux transporter [Longimicrobiales bacterium]|nr:MATE family efflux transporter [Longimicrobiales bacterium]